MTTLQAAQPAPIWRRIVAGIIDFFILWLFIWPAFCALGFGDIDREIEFMRTPLGWKDPVVPMIIVWLFPFCLRDLVGGRSFGKWLMGLRVADAANANAVPSAARLIVRNLTIWLSPVGIVLAALNSDRMRLGDRLTHSIVLEEPAPPSGPNWRVIVTKAAVFAAVAGAALYFAQFTIERYYRHSRAYGVAMTYLDGCGPMTELMPGAKGGDRAFQRLHFFPTPEGALAAAILTQPFDNRTATLTVIVNRPPDNVAGWRGMSVQAAYEPGWPADNAPRSSLNDAALSFLKTYAPLHAAVSELHAEKTTIDGAGVFTEKGKEWAGMVYRRGDERWAARFVVELFRGDGGWTVLDASGVVDLNIDNASARKVYVFRKEKNVSRFLSGFEKESYLSGGRLPAESMPDFAVPGDNATTKR